MMNRIQNESQLPARDAVHPLLPRRLAVKRPLVLFFIIAYAFSWAVFVPMVLLRAPMQWTILGSFGPSVAALTAHRLATGNYHAFRIHVGWPWTLIIAAFGIILILLAYVVLPGLVTADPRKLHWGILTSLAVYSYSTLLAGPLGEEPGWRGYALPRLEAHFGPVRASLLLAMLWAGWHLPLFLIPGWTTSPFWIFLLILIGLAVIMTYGVNLARFSVIVAIVMHAAFNTVSRFLNGLFANIQPHTPIPFDLVLAICGLFVAAILVLTTKGRLAYHRDFHPTSIIREPFEKPRT